MKFLSGRYTYFFLLLVIFVVSELIVNPIGDFPLNDDWCYGKAVYLSANGKFTIGNFGAMTLFTHIAWGMLFVKLFGFSFTVLRVSTFVSVIIGAFFLDRLVFKLTQNKLLAFFACLILLFNPLYFNLTNTYMTDVNFNTLLIVCFYFAFSFFESRKLIFVVLFFIFSILLVLLRQFGVIIPACFALACLTIKEKRWLWLGVSVAGAALVLMSLHLYENYLKEVLPPNPAYKFSGGIHVTDLTFWRFFGHNVRERNTTIFLHVCIYLAPLAAAYLFSAWRSFKIYTVISVVLIQILFVSWFFKNEQFPSHNIFENMILGPETFYESLKVSTSHTYSEGFALILLWVKYIFVSITLITLTLYIISLIKRERVNFEKKPEVVFLLSFIAAYLFMLCITESHFDRYYIPLISTGLILMTLMSRKFAFNYKPALALLLFFFYIAVFGTKDYLSWNRARWQAYAYLKETKQVNATKVNGGFEMNCLNDLEPNWWFDYTTLEHFDYLIQFKKEEGFKLLKAFPFQRYFPYKEDKLNLFVKEAEDYKVEAE